MVSTAIDKYLYCIAKERFDELIARYPLSPYVETIRKMEAKP